MDENSWKCVSDNNKGNLNEFTRIVLEKVPVLKDIIDMTISLEIEVYNSQILKSKIIEHVSDTFGLLMNNFYDRKDYQGDMKKTKDWIREKIEMKKYFEEGVLLNPKREYLDDKGHFITKYNTTKDFDSKAYFEKAPNYITLCKPTDYSQFREVTIPTLAEAKKKNEMMCDEIPVFVTITTDEGNFKYSLFRV